MADRQGNAEPEDLADESQYCKHGNYVGNWATGDYLCGWCEDGISDEEYRRCMILQSNRRMKARTNEKMFNTMCEAIGNVNSEPARTIGVNLVVALLKAAR